jgi:four helix bundle protein
MVARHYRDLICWQLANELKLGVYAFTAKPSVARDFRYCNQIRDSSRGAPRTIAEGFGRYRPPDFARYLEFARASLAETHNHLVDGLDLGYLTEPDCNSMCRLADRAAGATTKLLLYLKRRSSEPRRLRNREP